MLEPQVLYMTVPVITGIEMSVQCNDALEMDIESTTAVGMIVSQPISVSMDVQSSTAVDMILGTCVNMGGTVEHYTGTYNVIPSASDIQTLETASKFLEENVTVQKVPYYETSNTSGETVYIASEV